MKIIFRFFTIFLTLVAVQSFAKNEIFGLEKLVQDKDFESDCGCTITNSKAEFLVVSDMQEKAPATVRINGQKRELKWISSTEKNKNPKKGDTFSNVYAEGNVRLKLNYMTTFVCEKGHKSCEVTKYLVNGTIEDGKNKSRMKDLKGDCGC